MARPCLRASMKSSFMKNALMKKPIVLLALSCLLAAACSREDSPAEDAAESKLPSETEEQTEQERLEQRDEAPPTGERAQ